MWQRIRDYSSAINFSILNFLRRRNYEQFNENFDDSVADCSVDDNDVIDRMQTRDVVAPQTETCAIIEHIEVHSSLESNPRAISSSLTSYGGDVDTFTFNQHSTNKKLEQGLRHKADSDQGHHFVPHEVKNVVHSYSQNRYQRFQDESSEDEDFQITSAEETHQLHHGVKEVRRKTSNKTKRRKKIAKMTRRGVRGTWKWLKRGVMGYAGALDTANIFVLFYRKH